MSDRFLIINADDFGLCTETNDAVEHLFHEGRITSTTVMVPCEASGDAISRAKSNSKIKMGLHVTLNSDYSFIRWKSIAPSSDIPSILDDEGRFHHDIRLFYDNAKGQDVATEINAQYNFITAMDYRPTHADSHCGTLYGLMGKPFIQEAYELCVRYGLPFRLPKSKDFIVQRFNGNVPPEIEAAHANAVLYAEKLGIRLPDDMVTNPFSEKDIQTYENLKAFYLNAIRNIKEGVTELFLHPSKENAKFMANSEGWQKRIWEYKFLLDEDMMKTIQQEGIKLISWNGLSVQNS